MSSSNKTKINKRPLVLWSGGFDSTALVIDRLGYGDVDVLYIDLDNNDKMQRREKKAITKLKCLIKHSRLKGRIRNEYTFGYQTITVTKNAFALPGLWIQGAVLAVNPAYHSELNLGYVKGDDVWHYKTEVQKVYKAFYKLACSGEKKVPLVFPFEWQTKASVLANLQEFMYCEQVLNLIYYCEEGDKEPCGECGSCKRHINEVVPSRTVVVDMTSEYTKTKEVSHD